MVSRGNDALRIGDYDRAVVNFSKALDENPLDRDARYGLALSYYAIAEEKEKLDGQTLPLWERTVAEFRILWNVDSTASIREAFQQPVLPFAGNSVRKFQGQRAPFAGPLHCS